jgi:hypothetical protein
MTSGNPNTMKGKILTGSFTTEDILGMLAILLRGGRPTPGQIKIS